MKSGRGRGYWLGAGLALVVLCLDGVAVATPGSGGGTRAEAATAMLAPWQLVLDRYVEGLGVDYRSLAADREPLDRFLREIADHRPTTESREDVIAFWINAYNASVLRLVTDHYPKIETVRAVPGFFDEIRVQVAGEQLTLDEIESRTLPREEPRVHFALVCAAVSCPPLRQEAYRGATLDLQLGEQTRMFLADQERGARWDPSERVLYLSSLFKWYGGDFTGTSDIGAFLWRRRLIDYVRPLLPATTAVEIAAGELKVSYLEYDWSLNDSSR